jgi:quercetin dioxygenase-like cupin family protein
VTHHTDLRVNPSAELIKVGHLKVCFLITGSNSAGSIAAFELTVPVAKALPVPVHSHTHFEETIFGLDGVMTWTVDGKGFEVGPGEALCIPRGAVHRFDNRGDRNATALCVITPGVLGPQYFREQGALLSYWTQPPAARQTGQ